MGRTRGEAGRGEEPVVGTAGSAFGGVERVAGSAGHETGSADPEVGHVGGGTGVSAGVVAENEKVGGDTGSAGGGRGGAGEAGRYALGAVGADGDSVSGAGREALTLDRVQIVAGNAGGAEGRGCAGGAWGEAGLALAECVWECVGGA